MTPAVRERITQLRHGIVPEGYKRTRHGVLPKDWQIHIIEECLEQVSNPVDVEADTMYTQIGIRSHGKGLFYKDAVSGEALGNKSVFWIEPNCFVLNIVFAWEQAIGKTTQAEVGMIGSHRFPMYRPIEGKVDIDYLIYYLLTKRGTDILEAASPGGAGRNRTLGQERFMKSRIPLPPLPDQQKIAAILSAQDKVIELKEKRLAQKRRQKKYLAQKIFKSALSKKALKDLAKITMGQSPSSQSYNDEKLGLPLIQGNADICHRQTEPRMFTTTPTKLCQPNDILLSVRAPVGTVAKSNLTGCIGRGICSIHSDYMNEYIYEYLLYYEDKWGSVAQGSTFESISGDDIAKLMIPIVDKWKLATDVLSLKGREINLLQRDLEQEKQKKKALMQLLLMGIVRVKA